MQAASAAVESTYRAGPPLPLARCAEPGERFLRTVRLCTGRACPRPSIPCRRVVESCGFSCGAVGSGASDGRREKCDEKQRTCSETNEMAAHHTTPKSGVVLGYDREANDSHAAYLRGACYALEHGATRHQGAAASCDRYRSRGRVAQWAAPAG